MAVPECYPSGAVTNEQHCRFEVLSLTPDEAEQGMPVDMPPFAESELTLRQVAAELHPKIVCLSSLKLLVEAVTFRHPIARREKQLPLLR